MPDPLTKQIYEKRVPYREAKPTGRPFQTVLGVPDNQYLRERYAAAVKGGVFVGFNYGLFKTTIQDVPIHFAGEKFLYYSVRVLKSSMYGGFMGALYVAVVRGSSYLRGNKDDPLNHFFGGYALTSFFLVGRQFGMWMTMGTALGACLAAVKGLYQEDFEFSRQRTRMTNCRYPEMYLYMAKVSKEDLEK